MGLLMFIILIFNNWYYNSTLTSNELMGKSIELELQINNYIEHYKNLVYKESKGQIFENPGKERYLSKRNVLKSKVKNTLDYFHEKIENQELKNILSDVSNEIKSVHNKHELLIEKILQRGFKNYGLEGEMRKHVHKLEESYTDQVGLASIMMLRRHEKDFIIRKDINYSKKLVQKVDQLVNNLKEDTSLRANKAIDLLFKYKTKFLMIQRLENEIGYTEKKGLINFLDRSLDFVKTKNEIFQKKLKNNQTIRLAKIKIYFYLGWLFFFLIIITGSLWLSKLFTYRIKLLSDYMNHFVSSKFKYKKNLSYYSSDDEIGNLFKNFRVLEDQVTIHFDNYKNNVQRRTNEIIEQKKQIEGQKREIENQKKLLEITNNEIIDSIKYAEKIQKSILLRKDYIDLLFKEHFVLFKPKDIVSGDFYWGKKVGENIFFAIADCTGHGVPGAFMSIIGHNLLTYAIGEKKLGEPADILNFLNKNIKTVLQQTKQKNSLKDGMDIALFCLNTKTYELKFSGAQRPLIIAKNEKIIELKGNRFPAGGFITLKEDCFTQKHIFLQPGDQIFAFSDGYIDQFGGSKNKKFKYRPFKDLISTITDEPKEKQKEILMESFEIWKGKNPQVDDICVFSAKI